MIIIIIIWVRSPPSITGKRRVLVASRRRSGSAAERLDDAADVPRGDTLVRRDSRIILQKSSDRSQVLQLSWPWLGYRRRQACQAKCYQYRDRRYPYSCRHLTCNTILPPLLLMLCTVVWPTLNYISSCSILRAQQRHVQDTLMQHCKKSYRSRAFTRRHKPQTWMQTQSQRTNSWWHFVSRIQWHRMTDGAIAHIRKEFVSFRSV